MTPKIKIALIALLLMTGIHVYGQQKDKGNKTFSSGVFSLGGRSTWSLFNDQGSKPGSGVGGQFRLQFADQINSDWFFDYITSPVGNYANRTDYHIGWSVLFYPMKNPQKMPLFRPYILAGHCFDYTNIRDNKNADHYAERWSSAVQCGIGTHINLTERFDLSLTSQYMIHLGNEIDSRVENDQGAFAHAGGAKHQRGFVLQ